ncbi:DUF4097 family beta strand repeat-containing protein [Asanoa sp. NPDC049573]|uniref:DUF4097 family beta strand repeat-containing protein n=1 Tax=Asanoa sp. NPDC049573 TaxID=3155396 RepID=UPI0034305FEE
MPTFATPGPVALTVVVAGAKVRVNATDRVDTTVAVEAVNPADPSHVKVAEKTKVDFAAGQLSVKTTTSGENSGSVAITINLPAGSSLVSYLAHSDVRAHGSLGECELHLASGRIALDRITNLRANIAGGDVTIDRIGECATVDGARFALRIGEVGGAVKLSSSAGQVRIGHAAADLDLSSGNAGFDIDRADANATVKTGTGAIRIGQLAAGHADLANHAGNIDIGVNPASAAAVDADSTKGSVYNFLPPIQNPDNKVTVRARTRNGDITIAPAR